MCMNIQFAIYKPHGNHKPEKSLIDTHEKRERNPNITLKADIKPQGKRAKKREE